MGQFKHICGETIVVAPPDEQAEIRSASPEYFMERYEQEEDRWSNVSMESPLAIKFIDRVQSLASSKPSLTVLDAGCGRLGVAFMLRKPISNLQIVAIDFAYKAIVQTNVGLATKAERAGITFLDSNFMEFDWGRRFDIHC
jgi:ubiquinone/menaquinone biosynthesis C-methylase UbiE